jgi:CemA family
MQTSALTKLQNYFRAANQWFLKTPERALDEAYEAAQMIESLEETHFAGGKISTEYGNYSKSAHVYFQAELKKYLNIAKVRLEEFKLSSSILRLSNQRITEVQLEEDPIDTHTINIIDRPALILKKLKLVDEVLSRYNAEIKFRKEKPSSSALVTLSEPGSIGVNDRNTSRISSNRANSSSRARASSSREDVESLADKTGVLPRSILKTVDRIKRELDPEAEEEMVENFRNSKARTIVSLRFVLILIIIPLLTQQVSKNFLVGSIVDRVRNNDQVEVFLNEEMEEEALTELQRYEERLKFQVLIGRTPPLSTEQLEEKMAEKAAEVEEEFRERSSDAVKNVFADLISVVAFILIIINSKREIAVLKSFIDELIYGLSDSAKAFIIILLTDTFVGFHSPHGWEVLLEGISRHLGLPASRDFIFLFIATFPVVLDTVFKYWIFRYLNRISPSAVATYRNMNE